RMMLDRRAAVLGGAGAIAAMHTAASAQSTPEPNPEAVPGGTLRVGVQGDPVELDPGLVLLDAAGLVIDFAYEGLTHEGPDLSPQPRLATDWTVSDDGLTYTFNL